MNEKDADIERIIKENSLYQCLECGKCSASCPRLLSGKEYSPRLLAHKFIAEREDEAYIENSVWECLTCASCQERCPSGVDFSNFILEMRTQLAQSKGLRGYHSHDGAPHSWMRMMASENIVQNRLDWITPDLKTATQGPIMYFSGCLPYFDVFFSGIEVNTLSIGVSAIKLLNFLDIVPVVLPNERCCGHDLLWTGDRENFEALCKLNYREFKKAGVEEIIVSCPECYNVLNKHMREVIDGYDIKVTLLLELVEREVKKGGIGFKPFARPAVFQDPCRLARMSDMADVPRSLMSKVPELDLREMDNTKRGAICCGNSAFINCDAYSKRIQVKRLKEAHDTGADLLVTSCPKCMIHLTCAMRDPVRKGTQKMEIRDLANVLAEHIEWAASPKSKKKP